MAKKVKGNLLLYCNYAVAETNMAQDKYRKQISKKVRKGMKGYPIATKLVCGILKAEDAEIEPMKKWFSERDLRKSEKALSEVLVFIEENGAKSVSMIEQKIGCPHEEGIDYPEGESCPKCSYWKGRDRFTHEMLH